jgi:HEAT repeat protein
VRTRAVTAVGGIRTEARAEIDALIEALRDEPLRRPALEALVQLGKPAVPALAAALMDEEVRLDAAQALRRIDLQVAARAGVDRTTPADLPALIRTLTNRARSAEARRAAAVELGQLADAAVPAIPALMDMLGDAVVHQHAAQALGRIGKPAVPTLVARLRDADVRVRESAAVALARMSPGAREAEPALVEALQDRDREVRRAAALALETIGPEKTRAVPALIRVLQSEDAEPVRQAAIKALVRAEPEARDMVVAVLLEAVKDQRNYGVKMLAEWGLKKVDPIAAAKAGVP